MSKSSKKNLPVEVANNELYDIVSKLIDYLGDNQVNSKNLLEKINSISTNIVNLLKNTPSEAVTVISEKLAELVEEFFEYKESGYYDPEKAYIVISEMTSTLISYIRDKYVFSKNPNNEIYSQIKELISFIDYPCHDSRNLSPVIDDKLISRLIPDFNDIEAVNAYYRLFIKPIVGTKKAIQSIFDIVDEKGKPIEWFENGLPPYHYAVEYDRIPEEIDIDRIIELAEWLRNERSHLLTIRTPLCGYPFRWDYARWDRDQWDSVEGVRWKDTNVYVCFSVKDSGYDYFKFDPYQMTTILNSQNSGYIFNDYHTYDEFFWDFLRRGEFVRQYIDYNFINLSRWSRPAITYPRFDKVTGLPIPRRFTDSYDFIDRNLKLKELPIVNHDFFLSPNCNGYSIISPEEIRYMYTNDYITHWRSPASWTLDKCYREEISPGIWITKHKKVWNADDFHTLEWDRFYWDRTLWDNEILRRLRDRLLLTQITQVYQLSYLFIGENRFLDYTPIVSDESLAYISAHTYRKNPIRGIYKTRITEFDPNNPDSFYLLEKDNFDDLSLDQFDWDSQDESETKYSTVFDRVEKRLNFKTDKNNPFIEWVDWLGGNIDRISNTCGIAESGKDSVGLIWFRDNFPIETITTPYKQIYDQHTKGYSTNICGVAECGTGVSGFLHPNLSPNTEVSTYNSFTIWEPLSIDSSIWDDLILDDEELIEISYNTDFLADNPTIQYLYYALNKNEINYYDLENLDYNPFEMYMYTHDYLSTVTYTLHSEIKRPKSEWKEPDPEPEPEDPDIPDIPDDPDPEPESGDIIDPIIPDPVEESIIDNNEWDSLSYDNDVEIDWSDSDTPSIPDDPEEPVSPSEPDIPISEYIDISDYSDITVFDFVLWDNNYYDSKYGLIPNENYPTDSTGNYEIVSPNSVDGIRRISRSIPVANNSELFVWDESFWENSVFDNDTEILLGEYTYDISLEEDYNIYSPLTNLKLWDLSKRDFKDSSSLITDTVSSDPENVNIDLPLKFQMFTWDYIDFADASLGMDGEDKKYYILHTFDFLSHTRFRYSPVYSKLDSECRAGIAICGETEIGYKLYNTTNEEPYWNFLDLFKKAVYEYNLSNSERDISELTLEELLSEENTGESETYNLVKGVSEYLDNIYQVSDPDTEINPYGIYPYTDKYYKGFILKPGYGLLRSIYNEYTCHTLDFLNRVSFYIKTHETIGPTIGYNNVIRYPNTYEFIDGEFHEVTKDYPIVYSLDIQVYQYFADLNVSPIEYTNHIFDFNDYINQAILAISQNITNVYHIYEFLDFGIYREIDIDSINHAFDDVESELDIDNLEKFLPPIIYENHEIRVYENTILTDKDRYSVYRLYETSGAIIFYSSVVEARLFSSKFDIDVDGFFQPFRLDDPRFANLDMDSFTYNLDLKEENPYGSEYSIDVDKSPEVAYIDIRNLDIDNIPLESADDFNISDLDSLNSDRNINLAKYYIPDIDAANNVDRSDSEDEADYESNEIYLEDLESGDIDIENSIDVDASGISDMDFEEPDIDMDTLMVFWDVDYGYIDVDQNSSYIIIVDSVYTYINNDNESYGEKIISYAMNSIYQNIHYEAA